VAQGEWRTIGGEAVVYAAFEKLGLTEVLSEIGLKKGQIHNAALLVIGRLLHPAMSGKQPFGQSGSAAWRSCLARIFSICPIMRCIACPINWLSIVKRSKDGLPNEGGRCSGLENG